MTAAKSSNSRYVWAAVCGLLAFVLAKLALHHGFWLAVLIGIVVAVIVLLLAVVFAGREPVEFAGASAPDQPEAAPSVAPAMAVAPPNPPAPPEMTTAAAPVPPAPEPVPEPAPVPERAAEPVAISAPLDAAAPAPKPAAASRAKAAVKPKVAAPAKANAAPKPKVAKAKPYDGPSRLAAPRGGKADDLKEIEGIGPALEAQINGMGVWHFDQIAEWTEQDVAWTDGQMARFKGRIARDRWVAQAKIIVTDGLEAFRERAKTNDY